jgi:hypothetical protein
VVAARQQSTASMIYCYGGIYVTDEFIFFPVYHRSKKARADAALDVYSFGPARNVLCIERASDYSKYININS